MTDLEAINIIELDEDCTEYEELEAWAQLIKSGLVWQLQGSYQRGANYLIKSGTISREGELLVEN